MNRRLLFAVLATFGSLACVDYLVDVPGGGVGMGDAGRLDGGDAGGPGSSDAGLSRLDAGESQEPDSGFGPVCGSDVVPIKLSPLDLLIVLDVSYSMDYDQKWLSVRSAMKSFVTGSGFKGLGVGLQYFPLRAQCRADGYQDPAVPIGTLGGAGNVGATIVSSLDAQQMSGGTPTVPMLEGTTSYLKAWLTQHPDHRAVLVVATDGMPDQTCVASEDGLPNSLANVVTVAAQAAQGDPSVKTFVIGVGNDLVALDEFAQAGGTSRAIIVDTSQNADVAFLEALTQIRRDALGCDFDVPTDSNVLRTRAQVRFVPDDGSGMQIFPKVDSRLDCGGGEGWYFDDPGDPSKVILCDQTCETVTQGKTGELNVEFGCAVN